MGCSHSATVTTITAGLAREVCESCARVWLRFVESAVTTLPDEPPPAPQSFEAMIAFERAPRPRKCKLCAQPAVFMIPEGLTCDEHAWQAAAKLSWDDADPWVPIRIHRSNA